ncbi:pyridoxal phosphate-dependent aminotransferase [Aureibacter tunicatorum]|uniref:Aminotransferase n=1 Tax=Aureibacter tunicatorum TaxID=866807 RepID=A0AAE3XL02_9BACT|nr:aminotransferase class I/II-fold pyridoxal phosphate-dependent enzyme [Aureibacter tunicatorum]MDR6239781.1 aspartate/methionine/tyrosine aminotransferase [Aureibacter tunicatorum]BDD04256.1 aminotransferase [Aureibacter tunicatorum]
MIIETAHRLRTLKEYYFSKKLREVKALMLEGKPVINIGIGSPDLPPSQNTIKALVETANSAHSHGYQSYKGIDDLRNEMANWYDKTYNVEINPEEEILPLLGSKEGITHISLAFLNPGDKVLVPELAYPAYQSVAEMIGAQVIRYPLIEDEWTPDWENMKKLDLQGVKMMWVNYPNMPTGEPASKELFDEIIDFALENKILVCHDNPYSLILNTSKPISILSSPRAKECAIELSSLSKSHNMAGWRVGWISGSKDYIDAILKVKSNVDSGMFLGTQKAAIAALQESEEWHDERNKEYSERKSLVFDILNKLECEFDQSQTGMFIWAKVNSKVMDVEHLVDYLLYEYNVFLTPGFIFGDKGKRYIRISLCTNQEKLQEVNQRIESLELEKINQFELHK